MKKIFKALSVASIAHKSQIRKGDGGAPYINHLIEVAYLLSELAGVVESEVLEAAVLHDILEDTAVSKDSIRDQFGEKVLRYVEELSDDKSLSLLERRRNQLEHVSNASDEIKLIKLADHCSNISSIPPSWDRIRIDEYLEWSYSVASKAFGLSVRLAELYKQRYELARSEIPNV